MTAGKNLQDLRAEFVKDATEVLADIRVRLFGNFQNERVRAHFDGLAENFAGAIWDEAIAAGAVEIVRKAEAKISAAKGTEK